MRSEISDGYRDHAGGIAGVLLFDLLNRRGIAVSHGERVERPRFGERGIEGKVRAAQIARERKIPYLGICLGMQIAVVEYARHVAGMDGALASVVGGLTPAPVVAVPTSTGYGAALEGVTALLTMLSSCSSGVTVVGIDNGYGAACAVARLLPGRCG